MLTFTPPMVQVVPPILPETRGLARRLFSHYASGFQYAGVFILSDGTVAQDFPSPENDNTNIPYPWNINGEPYAWIDATPLYQAVTIVQMIDRPTPVSEATATILRNNGYADCITGAL